MSGNGDTFTIGQDSQELTTTAIFQTNDLDAFDFDCDEAPSTSAILMAKLFAYDSNVLLEVPTHETYQTNNVIDQSVQEMQYSKQLPFINASDIDITSDSNVISYDQYLKETENESIFHMFDQGLAKEITDMKEIFNQIETEVDKCYIERKYFEIEKKELFIENDRLLEHIICQDVMCIARHAVLDNKCVVFANDDNLAYAQMEQSFIDEYSSSLNKNEKSVADTPMNKSKKVRFEEPKKSISNIPKQADSQNYKITNLPLLNSTVVKSFTSASGSQPLGRTNCPLVFGLRLLEAPDWPALSAHQFHQQVYGRKERKFKKHTHKPKSEDSIQEELYLLNIDLCSPMRIKSINGKKYILVIVDDYLRFTWPPSVVSHAPPTDVVAPIPVDTTSTPSLTSVDQEAQYASNSLTLEDSHEPVLHQDVEEKQPPNA
ncbi:hypothetical protein Tco_1408021 [Tanacetum coccineum]